MTNCLVRCLLCLTSQLCLHVNTLHASLVVAALFFLVALVPLHLLSRVLWKAQPLSVAPSIV